MKELTPKALETLNKVIAWLEAGAPHIEVKPGVSVEGFDMSVGIITQHETSLSENPSCGTVCCIAGAITQFDTGFSIEDFALNDEWDFDYDDWEVSWADVKHHATELLGLDDDEASSLFEPYNYEERGAYTPIEAATVLKHFRDTGEVNWEILDAT